MVDPALLARLRALLEPRQEILEAYLFGSTARGTAQAHSARIETRRFGR